MKSARHWLPKPLRPSVISASSRLHSGSPRRAFTLIELLVVIAIIAILAALLLPALSRVKASGQSAGCKSHLHQMSLAMNMYVSDAHRYPFLTYWTNGLLISGIEWVDLLRPYYPIAWTNRAFHCPAYKGHVAGAYEIAGKVTSWVYMGSYGYNNIGTWSGHVPFENLGLGPASSPDYRRSPVTEAQVLAPGDMIEFGESPLELTSVYGIDNRMLWTGFDGITCALGTFVSTDLLRYPLFHGKNCNVAFCDAHVEGMPPATLFNPTNTASRWNNDHQPHPETW